MLAGQFALVDSPTQLAGISAVLTVFSNYAGAVPALLGTPVLVGSVTSVAASQAGIPDCYVSSPAGGCGAGVCPGARKLIALYGFILAVGPALVGLRMTQ